MPKKMNRWEELRFLLEPWIPAIIMVLTFLGLGWWMMEFIPQMFEPEPFN